MTTSERNIYNGADCGSYWWSQGHSDLEICIKINDNKPSPITPGSIKVLVQPTNIRVIDHSSDLILDGQFEHTVKAESSCWLVDSCEQTVTLYVDKQETLWWKQLLIGERALAAGPRSYTMPMDNLDESSKMVVDKLIFEQQNKAKQQVR